MAATLTIVTDRADESANGGDDTDFWLSIPGLRESLSEAEADCAAGRTFGEEEIRAHFGLPDRSDRFGRGGQVDRRP